jgi:hypothetical protein
VVARSNRISKHDATTGKIRIKRPDTKQKNQVSRTRIFKRLWGLGIDSKELIPPAYVAWRAGTITLFLLGS